MLVTLIIKSITGAKLSATEIAISDISPTPRAILYNRRVYILAGDANRVTYESVAYFLVRDDECMLSDSLGVIRWEGTCDKDCTELKEAPNTITSTDYTEE